MHKKMPVIFLAVILLLLSSGCAAKKAEVSESKKITVADETGRTVEAPCSPQRIVSINSYISELLCAFGVEDKIVARSEICSFPPQIKDKLSLGRSWMTPNLELLLEQKPDLVIADPCLKDELREKIEQAGIPVLLFKAYETEGVLLSIKCLGQILDKKERAGELSAIITRNRELVQERIEKLEPGNKPAVYFEDGRGPYNTVASETASHKRIVDAGGINVASEEQVKFPVLNAEWVLEKNPSIIVKEVYLNKPGEELHAGEVMEEVRNEIINRPGLKRLKATQDGQVHLVSSRLLTGPRSVIGLVTLAKWFHPELFSDVDPVAMHREMLQEFYGLELKGVWSYSGG